MGKMQKECPDVVITDLEMPRMDGLTFIRKIMEEMPTPVVVCSGLATRGTELAFRALEEGAVEVITKPKVGVRDFLHESAVTLLDAVWSASQAQIKPRPIAVPRVNADAVLPRKSKSLCTAPPHRADCGGGFNRWNGGLASVSRGLTDRLPTRRDCAAHARSLHRAFAERLNKECAIEVAEARDADRLQNGRALIAPGNRHMLINRRG